MKAIFPLIFPLCLGFAAPAARAETPSKVVRKTAIAPAVMSAEQALDSLEAIPEIFELYQPVVPWVPGLSLQIGKEVLSRGNPAILALPVSGSASYLPDDIHERAIVTAVADRIQGCPAPLSTGRRIVLSFKGSTRNVERRVDRIEVRVCASILSDGRPRLSAVGELYDGYLVVDPALNSFNEKIGAAAFQTAFLKQVEPMIDAVEKLWTQSTR